MAPIPGFDILKAVAPHSVWEWLTQPFGADPRVTSWPLLDSPWPPMAIGLAYLAMIPIGTSLMKDRKPWNVKFFATCHNAFLAGLSLYMVVETLLAAYENFGWEKEFSLWCNPLDRQGLEQGQWTKSAHRLASVIYIHYISKAYEFVDTFLMIVKKNNRQISFLHVYHHATTFFPTWYYNTLLVPGGDAWFCCFLNSLVHVFMYSHYLIRALGLPSPVKQFITQFQLIQFVLYISQSIYGLTSGCFFPRLPYVQLGFQCVVFLVLFSHFYINAYSKKPKSVKQS